MAGDTFELTPEQADKYNRALKGEQVDLDDAEATTFNSILKLRKPTAAAAPAPVPGAPAQSAQPTARPKPEEPSWNFVSTPSGAKLNLAGHAFEVKVPGQTGESDLGDMWGRAWRHALVLPAALDYADQFQEQVAAPVIRAGQTKLREAMGYEKDGKPVEERYRQNIAGGTSPVAQYLGGAAFQWLAGEKLFDNIPEDIKLKAINDIDALYDHPLFTSVVKDPLVNVATANLLGVPPKEAMSAATTALAQEGGKFPLYMLGPGKVLREVAAASPVIGGALSGAMVAGREALLDPTQKPSEAALMGGGLGAGIPLTGKVVAKGVEKAMPLVNRMAVASEYSGKFLRGVWEDMAGKDLGAIFDESLAKAGQEFADEVAAADIARADIGRQRVTAGKAWDAPPPAKAKPGEVISQIGKQGAPLQVPYSPDFQPSVVLMDNNSALAVKLNSNGPARVVRIPLADEAGAKKLQTLLENSNTQVEFVGNHLEDVAPGAKKFYEAPGGGNRDAWGEAGVPAGTDTRSGRMPTAGAGPLVVEHNRQTGNIDMYRLTSPRARERVMRTRGATLDGHPTGGGLMEFTMPDGSRKKGYLLGTTTGMDLVFTPGHDADRLPGLIDQVVSVDSHVAAARQLSDKELRALSRIEPEQVKQYRERRQPGLKSFRDMQSVFNRHVDSLTKEQVSSLRPLLDPPKPIEQVLNEWHTKPKTALSQAVEKAVTRTKMLFGVSREQATTLLQIAHFRRMAIANPKQAATWAKKAEKLMAAGEAMWKLDGAPTDPRLWKAGGEMPAAIPGTGKMFTPRVPFTPEEIAARKLVGQSGAPGVEDAKRLMLNDGRMVEVVHEETRGGQNIAPKYSESHGTIMVRAENGDTFNVKATDVAGPVEGGAPRNREQVPMLAANNPPAMPSPVTPPPPKPPPYYAASDSKFADDVAYTMRHTQGDERQWQLGAIFAQAKKDGMPDDVISKMVKDAMAAAVDDARVLNPPSWNGAAGSGQGGKPPRPPELPVPGSPPEPPRPEMQHSIQELPAVQAMVKDKTFVDRVGLALFGHRYTDPKDMVAFINQTYGAKALEKRKTELLEAMQRVTGQKLMSDFSKDYLHVAEGRMSMADMESKYPTLFTANPEVKRVLSNALTMRDINHLKLQQLGGIPTDMSDEELINYVYHGYARNMLEPGEWAKMVKNSGTLFDEGVAYFTKKYADKKTDSTSLAEAKSKAIETVNRLIGEGDAEAFRQASAQGKAQDSLKGRKLDELERLAIEGKEKNGTTLEDVKMIRKLLGQNEDGFLAVATSIARQQTNIANLTMWNELVAQKPELFSRQVNAALDSAGWKKVPENRAMYGPAAGKYMHPDAYDALITQPSRVATANKLLTGISSWVKGNKTSLGATTTWNANFFGNVVYSALAGADPLSGKVPNFKRAIQDIYGSFKDPFSAHGRAIDDARRLGLDVSGFGQTEFAPFREQYAGELAKNLTGLDSPVGIMRRSWEAVQKVRGNAAALYDMNDRVWKLSTYYSLCEKGGLAADGTVDMQKAKRFLVGNERIDKAKMERPPFDVNSDELPSMTPEQAAELIKREAVYRVTASFPDPTKVSYLVDKARKTTGFLAPFLTFKAEDARIWASVPKRIMRGEKDLAYRLMGYAIAIGGMGYGSTQLARANGISEEDENAAYSNLPKTTRGFRPMMITVPFRDSEGRVQFIDLSQYIGWSQYLRGLDLGDRTNKPVGPSTVGTIFANAIKAPVEGGVSQRWVDELVSRAGFGDPSYQLRLREDQKGMAAAMGFLWNDVGLLPKGLSQPYDIYRQAHTRGPYSEPLSAGQAAAKVAGFTVIPSGEGSKLSADRELSMKAADLLKNQVSAGKDVFNTPRDVPNAIEGAVRGETDQERIRRNAVYNAQQRTKVLQDRATLSDTNRKANK